MLELDGTKPQKLSVADLTPERSATPVFGVMADYGWASRALFSNAYERDARDIATILGEHLGIPVED